MGWLHKLFQKPENSKSCAYDVDAVHVNENVQVKEPKPSVDARVTICLKEKPSWLNALECVGGTVYCDSGVPSKSVIGFYEKTDGGKNSIVWDKYREIKIGIVPSYTEEFELSLEDLYRKNVARMKQNGLPYPPMPHYLYSLRLADHCKCIFDNDWCGDGELIAKYDGDGFVAAAAVVCGAYEVLDDTKYNDFFYGWLVRWNRR